MSAASSTSGAKGPVAQPAAPLDDTLDRGVLCSCHGMFGIGRQTSSGCRRSTRGWRSCRARARSGRCRLATLPCPRRALHRTTTTTLVRLWPLHPGVTRVSEASDSTVKDDSYHSAGKAPAPAKWDWRRGAGVLMPLQGTRRRIRRRFYRGVHLGAPVKRVERQLLEPGAHGGPVAVADQPRHGCGRDGGCAHVMLAIMLSK